MSHQMIDANSMHIYRLVYLSTDILDLLSFLFLFVVVVVDWWSVDFAD